MRVKIVEANTASSQSASYSPVFLLSQSCRWGSGDEDVLAISLQSPHRLRREPERNAGITIPCSTVLLTPHKCSGQSACPFSPSLISQGKYKTLTTKQNKTKKKRKKEYPNNKQHICTMMSSLQKRMREQTKKTWRFLTYCICIFHK